MDYTKYCAAHQIFTDKELKSYLELGWDLLFVGQSGNGSRQDIAYVVGWPKETGTPKEPEKPKNPSDEYLT